MIFPFDHFDKWSKRQQGTAVVAVLVVSAPSCVSLSLSIFAS